MTDDDWAQGYVRCLGVRLAGDAMDEKDSKGRPLLDETFLLLLNAHHEPRPFTLPAHKTGVRWQPVFDTALYDKSEKEREENPVTLVRGGEQYDLEARSLALLRLRHKQPPLS
jgi:glycogen operon protein